ncbi:MAG: hypothetical protein AB1689_15900 [Thermodesulfobacteriota bacterium]
MVFLPDDWQQTDTPAAVPCEATTDTANGASALRSPDAPPEAEEGFDFYGLTVAVEGHPAELVDQLRRDFAFFRRRAAVASADVRVEIRLEEPPWECVPALPASVFTPRNVSFTDGVTTYLDYFGRGLAVLDRRDRSCVVHCPDPDLAHEIAYLFLLSTVGQHLDARGLHRVHALGVSHRGQGILLLLPSGGGKSTLALELLSRPGFFLLSEDTPLVDRRGRLLPFPLRLGVRPEERPEIPPQYLRTVRRMEFDPKTLIDLEYFRGRIGDVVPAKVLLVGERNSGAVSAIVPTSNPAAFRALVKYMVVGLGVYQGLEFLLERGAWELAGQSGVVASRTASALQLLARVRPYRFVLGRDRDRNTRTLLEFLARGNGVA